MVTWSYDPGDKRRKHKWDKEYAGFEIEGGLKIGKCPRPVYIAHGDNAPLQYGLIAEEVAEVYPELVARNKDGEVETVMYQFLAPMLLNEVQKQHRQIEDQQKVIDALDRRLKALEKRAPVYQ